MEELSILTLGNIQFLKQVGEEYLPVLQREYSKINGKEFIIALGQIREAYDRRQAIQGPLKG